MNKFAVICNFVLFGFTCGVLVTDGAPHQPVYIALTGMLLLLPLLNTVLLVYRAVLKAARRVLAAANVALIAFVGWAIADQYPHPEEEGVVAFMTLCLFVPLLSAVLLFRSEPRPRAEMLDQTG